MNLAEFLPSFLSFDFSHFCEMNIFEGTPCSLYVRTIDFMSEEVKDCHITSDQ